MSKELEDRFHNYAKAVRDFCKRLRVDDINQEYIKQLIRSSASVSANYIEASDCLGKADERMKIRISRREIKETLRWIDLVLLYDDPDLEKVKSKLLDEGEQIRRILSTIAQKLGSKASK